MCSLFTIDLFSLGHPRLLIVFAIHGICLLAGLIGSSPVTEQRDPLKERVKEHRVRRFHSSGDTARRPISCKLNNRDASITQFAVIDDDNVSALQQVTRGGGGKSLTCSVFLNVR